MSGIQTIIFRALLFCYFMLQTILLSSQTLTICVEGIRNNEGVIRLAFYHNDEEFQHDKPFRSETVRKDTLSTKSFCIPYSGLKAGTYGVALLDDENENNRMDYKLLIPAEGFGFSDYNAEGAKRPKFDDFKFKLDQQGKKVKIRIKYF